MKQLFNLKSYIIFLSRNKVYTAINVFGLSISLMFVLLIGISHGKNIRLISNSPKPTASLYTQWKHMATNSVADTGSCKNTSAAGIRR